MTTPKAALFRRSLHELARLARQEAYVRVADPNDPAKTWTGVLSEVYAAPPVMVIRAGVRRRPLPRRYPLQELPAYRVRIFQIKAVWGRGPCWTWCMEIRRVRYDDIFRLSPYSSWENARDAALAWLETEWLKVPLVWHYDGDGDMVCDGCGGQVYRCDKGEICSRCSRTPNEPEQPGLPRLTASPRLPHGRTPGGPIPEENRTYNVRT
ncbi:hypothetical protein AB0F17_35180 [Nonomuraea sp. NPDC026600]|uniref:hypothetical protein n=1 Tax=Nonomuraea sp. NPDC026600 TaxID=3155363 RepID=UPI0034060914